MAEQPDAPARGDLLDALLLGKLEIAELARVRRPVVTMWIARHRSSAAPFPAPVTTTDGRELYRATEVVDWIGARRLGNNQSLREDVVAHSFLQAEPGSTDRGRPDRRSALLTLVALRAALGEPLGGLDARELIAAAERIDPDDRCLAREVAAIGDRLPELAGIAELLCDAAYGPGPAYAALQRRSGRPIAQSGTAVADRALDLVGALGAALVAERPVPQILDPDPHDASLLLAVRDALGEHVEPELRIGAGDARGHRATRRQLLAAGLPIDDESESAGSDPPVVISRLSELPAGAPPTDAVHGLVRQFDATPDASTGIVLGPAAVLTDRIADPAADALRWDLLRGDRVRSVVRLPEGLLPSRPGVALALWILGPRRDLPADERWMTIADLSAVHLDRSVTDALVTDVLASLGPYADTHRHAFAFARIVRTASVIARGALLPVPPPTVAPGRTVGAADVAVTIQLTADTTSRQQPPPAPAIRVQAATTPRARLVPAGRLATDQKLRVLPGTRIDPRHLDDTGAVVVIGPDEIHGRTRIGTRHVDRLTFTTQYPRAGYTEPGDVVFCTSPALGAMVDAEGSHAVLAPARILRIADPAASGLVPELVAAQLRRLVPDRKPAGSIRATAGWRTWLLPVLDPETVPGAADVLAGLAAHRRVLAGHLSAVDDLMQSLTAHLADGVVTVEPAPAPPGRGRRGTGTR